MGTAVLLIMEISACMIQVFFLLKLFLFFFYQQLFFLKLPPLLLFQCFQIFFLLNQHQKETADQDYTGNPYGAVGKIRGQVAAAGCANGKGGDSGQIDGCGFPFFFLFSGYKPVEMIHTASQVTDTHGAGIGAAADCAEGLHLHGTGKGGKCVCQPVYLWRQKADHKEQQDFHDQNQMTPVDLSGVAAFAADKAGSQNTQRKTKYRMESRKSSEIR